MQNYLLPVVLCHLIVFAVGVNVELLKPYATTAANMYHTADTNHDSVFTYEEFKAEFHQYDINNDGIISRHEYTSYVCFLTPVMYDLSHYLFDKYDVNPTDHRMEETDFQALYYTILDKDGSGVVDENEWVTWWVQELQGLEGAGRHQHGSSTEHGSQHCQ